MTPARIKEAEEATSLFHIALVSIGAKAVEDSLHLWNDVPPVANVENTITAQRWLTTAVTYVMRRRLRARDMALAYFRYQRALLTGRTVALPGQDNPPYMTLPELKRQFETYLTPDAETPEATDDDPTQEVEVPESERIPVDTIEGLEEDLDALEREMESRVEENLRELGPKNQDRKTKREDKEASTQETDASRSKANSEAGNRQAASAARNVMNGARASLYLIGDRDRRTLGFVRVSRTGTPCGFCALLISRGPVLKGVKRMASLYKSGEGTGPQEDGTFVTYGDLDLYHDNCQCYAVPVFSLQQFESGEIFALNRKYASLWDSEIKGKHFGTKALTEWRRLIRREAKSQKTQVAAA